MLKLLILIPLLGSVCAQYGGLFKEYKEDLNEYLTSEEVDRLVFANDESVISEKIKNLPDGNMSPPGVGKHHLPMPTMDPALESVPNPPIVKKLPPPQRNNFMSMMKNAARMLTSRTQNRSARSQQQPQSHMKPVPHFRARPSTLTSSNPDPLEVAFKRIEIMASRAGLNMSSIPRRNQMQVVKRLIPKLPPRMAQLMKTTMDHNSARLYDYLPEPARDPLVEDDPNYLNQFMDGAKVTMDGAEYSLNDHSTHTFEFVEPTHEIIANPNDDITLSDHQPGTDYSVPTFDSASPSVQPSFGFSAPPSFEHSAPIGGFGSSGSSGDFHNSHENIHGTSMPASLSASIMSSVQKSMSAPMTQTGSVKTSAELLHPLETGPLAIPQQHQQQPSYHNSPLVQAAHNIDLRPIAAPLIGETHEIFTAEASENFPTIISPGSSKNPRSNKALKITSIKNATPSTPIIRVSMPTKDDLKVQKPIRVSIISKDDIIPSVNPFSATAEPVVTAEVAEVKEVKPIHKINHHHSNHHSHHSSHSVEEILRESSAEVKASLENSRPRESVEIRKSESVEIRSKESSAESARPAPTTTTTTTQRTTTPVRTTTTTENTITLPAAVDEFIPLPTSGEKFRGDTVPSAASPSSSAGLLLKEFDDYADDQDLSSSELLAELKKYNLDYANSLELDYPLAPHPLEYPDHPEHPDNSDPVLSTASSMTSPRPSPMPMQQEQPRPHGPPPRPPPRPPMRPRVRPPPRFPHGHPHRPHNRHHPRRPPPPGPVRPPLRVNDVTVSQIPQMIQKECDYFSEDLCLAVQDYPIEAISEAVGKIDASTMLVKEPGESNWVDGVGRQQEGGYNYKHYFGDGKVNNGDGGHRHRDFAGEGGFLCPSKVAYGRVKKGKSYTTGEWKYIVNYGDNSQTLRLEKCLSPGNSCSYVLPHYRTACTQVYNYHRLLAWDSEKGLHMDIFKVPTCCTCHVQGYYIPGQQHGVTPARRRDLPPKLQHAQQQARLRQAYQQSKVQHAQKHQQQQQIQQAAAAAQQQASIRREQAQQAQQVKLQQSKLNDELQELLAQYSSLRERIAKKKNERQSVVTYSMTYSNSTKENSKRESSNQEAPLRNATTSMKRLQRAMVMNIMKRMKKANSTNMKKKLSQMLKLTSLPSKPTTDSKSHFNGTAHKIKAARAIKLHKLAQLLTNINKNAASGANSKSSNSSPPGKAGNKQAAAITAALSRRLQGQRSLMNMARRTRSGRQHSMESKLDKLKLLLSRSLQKRRPNVVPSGKMQGKQGASPVGGKNPERHPIKRLQLLQQLQQRRRNSQNNNSNSNNRTKQRLRPGSKKPNSKVNYSYHPIMDYFGGSKPS